MKYNKVKKHKHLSFEDRCTIEEYLNYGYNFTQIANRLGKDRTTISNEVRKHRFLRGKLNSHKSCCYESKSPYVCNGCCKKTFCKKTKYGKQKQPVDLTSGLFLLSYFFNYS